MITLVYYPSEKELSLILNQDGYKEHRRINHAEVSPIAHRQADNFVELLASAGIEDAEEQRPILISESFHGAFRLFSNLGVKMIYCVKVAFVENKTFADGPTVTIPTLEDPSDYLPSIANISEVVELITIHDGIITTTPRFM